MSKAVESKVQAYLLINQEIKDLKAHQERLKAELAPYLDEAEENARGSRVIAFREPLEVHGTRYASLQRVRKVARVLNEDKALEFLKSDQAFESAIITVEHVDQDALWDLFVNNFISQEELDSMFTDTISWAFQPTKE